MYQYPKSGVRITVRATYILIKYLILINLALSNYLWLEWTNMVTGSRPI
jgi:hypothetical protein